MLGEMWPILYLSGTMDDWRDVTIMRDVIGGSSAIDSFINNEEAGSNSHMCGSAHMMMFFYFLTRWYRKGRQLRWAAVANIRVCYIFCFTTADGLCC